MFTGVVTQCSLGWSHNIHWGGHTMFTGVVTQCSLGHTCVHQHLQHADGSQPAQLQPNSAYIFTSGNRVQWGGHIVFVVERV